LPAAAKTRTGDRQGDMRPEVMKSREVVKRDIASGVHTAPKPRQKRKTKKKKKTCVVHAVGKDQQGRDCYGKTGEQQTRPQQSLGKEKRNRLGTTRRLGRRKVNAVAGRRDAKRST